MRATRYQQARLRAAALEVQLALSGGEALDHPLVTRLHALIQHRDLLVEQGEVPPAARP